VIHDHEDDMVKSAAGPDHAARRTHVIGALADAVSTLHRPWPVRVAVDALSGAVAPDLADELASFPHDDPAYATAVAELGLQQTALDLACGTGRALPHLRSAVGLAGIVLALDLTPEMLATARRHGRHAHAWLVLADARRLPLRTGSIDAAFVAGLLPHLPEPTHTVTELARVMRHGGRLCLVPPKREGRARCTSPTTGPNHRPAQPPHTASGSGPDRLDPGPL
jgi:ubiquinone/menaquinone biosynthesis C-methylase UbiE